MKLATAAIAPVLLIITTYPVDASCVFVPGRVVRGFVLRCERAAPYLEAASAAKPYRQPIAVTEDGVTLGPPIDLAEISESKYPGTIVVMQLHSELRLRPVSAIRGIKDVRSDGKWTDVHEHGSFWWHGSATACARSKQGETVELWVHPPCCDTLPSMAACLADMDYAEPVPDDLRRQLSQGQSD